MKFCSSLTLVVVASWVSLPGADEPLREPVASSLGGERTESGRNVGRTLDPDPGMPYAYLVPSNAAKEQYELSIEDLLTLVAELREAAAQSLARGKTRVPINTIEALLQDKAIEPVLRTASQFAGVPCVRVKRPALSAVESRTILAQVRARARTIRAARGLTAVGRDEF